MHYNCVRLDVARSKRDKYPKDSPFLNLVLIVACVKRTLLLLQSKYCQNSTYNSKKEEKEEEEEIDEEREEEKKVSKRKETKQRGRKEEREK